MPEATDIQVGRGFAVGGSVKENVRSALQRGSYVVAKGMLTGIGSTKRVCV